MRSVQLFRKRNATRVFRTFWDSSRIQKYGRNSLNDKEKDQDCIPQDPYELNFRFTECDQVTKVTVIGAAGRVGKTLSLLLKTCPLIDHLCLFDTDKSVKGVGVDISHIDTRCNVSYVCGMRNIKQALDAPDVVIIAAGCPTSPHLNAKKLFEKNAPVVASLSEACARFCPKACIILITSPINSLLPVVGGVFEIIANRIPSRKLFGLTTLDVVRANTFVAEAVRKDPSSMIVPVIGGTSQETLVPVISQMKPYCKIKKGEMVALTECLKRAEENLVDCQNCGTRGASSLSTAYAGFRFTTSLIMALKGAENIVECAFVKSDIIPELEYLASPLKLGVRGIEYNFGYPPLSDYELAGFQHSAAVLMSDIKMGKAFVSSVEETIQEGIVWKRLTDENSKASEETNQPAKEASNSQGMLQVMRKRRQEEKRKLQHEKSLDEAEPEPQPTRLTQEVYSEGVRNWAANSSLKRLFEDGGEQENCSELTTGSISAGLDCRSDTSFHVEKLSEDKPTVKAKWETNRLSRTYGILGPLKYKKLLQLARGYHTVKNGTSNAINSLVFDKKDKYRSYLMEDRQKKKLLSSKQRSETSDLVLKYKTGKLQSTLRKSNWSAKVVDSYKDLNASAKQKFRTFNTQKRFTPSASALLVLDKKTKSPEPPVTEAKKICEEGNENKVNVHQNKEEEEDLGQRLEQKHMALSKERERYREYIYNQLQDLRKENEKLKRRLVELSNDKVLESTLTNRSNEDLELERTKLKACWLIMSSTLDTFSTFCKKFISKTDGQLIETPKQLQRGSVEEEENEDEETVEEAPETISSESKKTPTHDKKYLRFLERLMEDRMERDVEAEKRSEASK